MKAFISAFALLGFVAAATIPFVAANAQTIQSMTAKKKTAKKPVKKASSTKKTGTKKSTKKTMNQPA